MISVTVWNENLHEQTQPEVREIYPQGIHGCIAEFLGRYPDLSVRTAVFDEPEHGLSQEILDHTDVLIYWSHMAQEEFSDEVAERVRQAVLRGMGLIALHSAHYSKIMRKLMGTSMTLRWRHGDRERLFITAPAHPISRNLPDHFELPVEEMYGEYFDIPKPDEVGFTGWFAGGEVFRSGCTFQRGLGKIFYFQPGHETCPTYHDKNIQQVIANAVYWCNPVRRSREDLECTEVKCPLEGAEGGAFGRTHGEAEYDAPGKTEWAVGSSFGRTHGEAGYDALGKPEGTERGTFGRMRSEAGYGAFENPAKMESSPCERREETGVGGVRNGADMKLSTFFEHIREASQQTGKSVEELLREVRKAGIRGIEMDYAVLAEQPELNQKIRDAGLEISNLYHFFEFGKRYAAGLHMGRKMIDTAARMGIRRVMIIPGFLDPEEALALHRASGSYEEAARFMEGSTEISSMRDAIAELTEYAAQKGIMVSMEDFDSYTSPIARMYPIKWFLEQAPGLRHTLDMGNYTFCDEDPKEAFEVLKDYIGHVHCKDRGEEPEEEEEIRRGLGLSEDAALKVRKGLRPVPVGEGYMPIAELVEKLKAQNYKGYLAIEHFGAPDQLAYLLQSTEYLRGILE